MNNVNQHFKNKSVKAKQLGTQSNTSQRLRKKKRSSFNVYLPQGTVLKAMSRVQRTMHFNRNYSNVNAKETRQGLPVKILRH